MNARHDWSRVPSPSVLVAAVAFSAAVYRAVGLTLRGGSGPATLEYDDHGGSSLVLDISESEPVLVVIDHDERQEPLPQDTVTTTLGLTTLPGMYARHDPATTYTGAARWNGSHWSRTLGVPGLVAADRGDDKHLLADASDALGEFTEGECDEVALRTLLEAVRAGDWDEDTVAAAMRCAPYEDDEELAAAPDLRAAADTLNEYRPLLRLMLLR
ncbi:hypothetical protein [Streptomyces sp. SH5]|uniref:hypothetical protein n=1 Tax=Streptomyces sp. SH5 TaxID=3041765 RepID=UPI0024781D16|nr:hypothetical protein [Streptomyces sp. SH5]WGP08187.1 hypothetical protein QFA72_00110 [Streptomyces sp. SH5]